MPTFAGPRKVNRGTTNPALQILENSGFKLTYSIVVKSDGLKTRTNLHKSSYHIRQNHATLPDQLVKMGRDEYGPQAST